MPTHPRAVGSASASLTTARRVAISWDGALVSNRTAACLWNVELRKFTISGFACAETSGVGGAIAVAVAW